MSETALAGLAVAITRPAGTATALAARLTELDANVLEFPAIGIKPLDLDPLDRERLEQPERFDRILFVSPTAVTQYFARRSGGAAGMPTTGAVGPGTVAALKRHGVRRIVARAAGAPAGAEALLSAPELARVEGERILIVAGRGGRDVLPRMLRERGAEVSRLALYERLPPADIAPLDDWLESHPHAFVHVTSVTALDYLVRRAQETGRHRLLRASLVVPSSRVVKQADSRGFTRVFRAKDASDAALITTLSRWRDANQ